MSTQNELFNELVVTVLEYVAALKKQIADLSASDASKTEIINQKTVEAEEAIKSFEDFKSLDVADDTALIEAIEKFKADLEATKA